MKAKHENLEETLRRVLREELGRMRVPRAFCAFEFWLIGPGLPIRRATLRADRVAERGCRSEARGGTMHLERAMGESPVRIESLSRDERLDLLERLWDSLSATPGEVPVTQAQQAELDRRSEALDRNVAEGRALGVPWDEVVRQLRARR